MDRFSLKRLRQLLYYGWRQSREIGEKNNTSRFAVFFDMLNCYRKYHLWSNQYRKENFYGLDLSAREDLGMRYKVSNDEHDNWVRDKYANRRFLYKYTTRDWDLSERRDKKRYQAYQKRYNIGEGGIISTNVVIERNHFLCGSISIGKNVLLAKNVYIDYSGDVGIKDNVQLTNGVIIETHHHAFHSDPYVSREIVIPTKLLIEEGAVLGSRCIILSSCNYIGKNARVGAGAVVTKDVPDYAIVGGVPAREIRSTK